MARSIASTLTREIFNAQAYALRDIALGIDSLLTAPDIGMNDQARMAHAAEDIQNNARGFTTMEVTEDEMVGVLQTQLDQVIAISARLGERRTPSSKTAKIFLAAYQKSLESLIEQAHKLGEGVEYDARVGRRLEKQEEGEELDAGLGPADQAQPQEEPPQPRKPRKQARETEHYT